MKSIFLALIILLSFLSRQDQWEWVDTREGIIMHKRVDEEGRFWMKLNTTIYANRDEIVAFTKKIDQLPNWVYACSETKLIEEKGNNTIYYTVTDMPFPMTDRDAVAIKTIDFIDSTNTVSSITRPYKKLQLSSDLVRVDHFEARWFFTYINDDVTEIEYYIMTDAVDGFPGWLKEKIVKTGPFESLKNLKNHFEKP